MPYIYAFHDNPCANDKNPMIPVTVDRAHELNKKGYGIFVSINDFKTPQRRIANLKRVVSWAIDIDDAPKEEQVERLRNGLTPSLVVESKRSLHAYWRAKDATLEDLDKTKQAWELVQADRLIPFYKADKNAKDIARVLRMPGFYHMKNPSEPFLVSKIWEFNVSYTLQQMLMFYPDANFKKKQEQEIKKTIRETTHIKTAGDSFWEKAYSIDCETGLNRLSGHASVAGEVFTFKQNNSGTKNIIVNGKSTSSWIDKNGRIGSMSKGGPSIVQWLRWYNHSWVDTVKIIKEVFPECN